MAHAVMGRTLECFPLLSTAVSIDTMRTHLILCGPEDQGAEIRGESLTSYKVPQLHVCKCDTAVSRS